jgi:PEP-CTERM motif
MQNKWLSAVLVIACVALLSGIGFASDCTSTTMDVYTAPGFSCGIDDKTFSHFTYNNSPGAPLPGSVNVDPLNPPGQHNPGFQFNAGWFAGSGSVIDSLIKYTVNVNAGGLAITDISLSIGGSGWNTTGGVFVDETVCLGATFPACSGGRTEQLHVFDSAAGTQLFDSISFAGVTEVDVEKDILLEGGSDPNGNARLSLVTNQYSEGAVPEPGSILLFGSGALALAGVLRRKLHR